MDKNIPCLDAVLYLGPVALRSSGAWRRQTKRCLRDGQEIAGRLSFVDESSIQINGKSIERTQVKLRRLADATNAALWR